MNIQMSQKLIDALKEKDIVTRHCDCWEHFVLQGGFDLKPFITPVNKHEVTFTSAFVDVISSGHLTCGISYTIRKDSHRHKDSFTFLVVSKGDSSVKELSDAQWGSLYNTMYKCVTDCSLFPTNSSQWEELLSKHVDGIYKRKCVIVEVE